MKRLLSVTLLSSTILSPIAANAETTEIRLVGTITPAACTPNFTGGATIDYGNIPASSLNSSAETSLPEKMTKLSITCDSPATFYLKVNDERAATVVPGLSIGTITSDSHHALGLGAVNGTSIGAYSLQFTGETADTGTTQRLISYDRTNWAVFSGYLGPSSGGVLGFSDGSSTTPAAHTSMSINVSVRATIDKASNLPVENEIPIDGLATIEVIYP